MPFHVIRRDKIFNIKSNVQADRHAVHVPAGRRRGSVDVRVRVNLKGNISAGTPAVKKKSKRALYPEHNSIRIVLKTSCKGAKADTVVPSQGYGHLDFFWS